MSTFPLLCCLLEITLFWEGWRESRPQCAGNPTFKWMCAVISDWPNMKKKILKTKNRTMHTCAYRIKLLVFKQIKWKRVANQYEEVSSRGWERDTFIPDNRDMNATWFSILVTLNCQEDLRFKFNSDKFASKSTQPFFGRKHTNDNGFYVSAYELILTSFLVVAVLLSKPFCLQVTYRWKNLDHRINSYM